MNKFVSRLNIFIVTVGLANAASARVNDLAGRLNNISIDAAEDRADVLESLATARKRLWITVQERRNEGSEEWIEIPLVYFFTPSKGEHNLHAVGETPNPRYETWMKCADKKCENAEIRVADKEIREILNINYRFARLHGLNLSYELDRNDLNQASRDEKEIARLLLRKSLKAEYSRFDIEQESSVVSTRVYYSAHEFLWLRAKRVWRSEAAKIFVGTSGNRQRPNSGRAFEGSFKPTANGFRATFENSVLKKLEL